MTNGQLLAYHNEIQAMSGSILGVYFRSKNKAFYNDNGIRINGLLDRHKAILREFYVTEQVDGGEKFKLDEKGNRVLKEGKTDDDLRQRVTEFMEEGCNIIL